MEIDKIICGDNVEVLSEFPDGCIDLVVTSPPYSDLRDYKKFSWDFYGILKQIYRITKSGGVCVWIVGDKTKNGCESGESFRQALSFMENGFNLHDTMIYEKTKISFPETNRYYNAFEYMFVFSKGKPKTINLISDKKNIHSGYRIRKTCGRNRDGSYIQSSGARNANKVKEFGVRTNIWTINSGLGSSDRISHKHPAIFPEKLANDHIISWSNIGDLVLDPFVGSGTTCKMAKKLGRHFIGIDVSQEYCDIAEQRIAD